MVLFLLRKVRKKLKFGHLLSLSGFFPDLIVRDLSLSCSGLQMKGDLLVSVALSIKLKVFKMHNFFFPRSTAHTVWFCISEAPVAH